jgi:hypothetical protein
MLAAGHQQYLLNVKFAFLPLLALTETLLTWPPLLLADAQEERQAAAEALVTALVDSQKQYDASHRAKGAKPGGSFEQDAGNRQQRMEQCLSCCSPLMVRPAAAASTSAKHTALFGFARLPRVSCLHSMLLLPAQRRPA